MLHIVRGTTNDLPVTLNEKKVYATGTTIYYLCKFVNDMTNKAKYGYGAITGYARYTNIRLIEGTDITLTESGFWTYTIYEVTSNSLTNDTGLATSSIVEKGKAFVKDNNVTEVSYTQYTPTDNTNTTNNNTSYIKL